MSRDSWLYLEDMLDACVRITAHRAGDDRGAVPGSPKTRDAVL